jgi:hypothetical protein
MKTSTSVPRIYAEQHGLELKAARQIDSSCEKQLLNYLRTTDIEVGILFNFGPEAKLKRYVFESEKKNSRESALIRGKEVGVSD